MRKGDLKLGSRRIIVGLLLLCFVFPLLILTSACQDETLEVPQLKQNYPEAGVLRICIVSDASIYEPLIQEFEQRTDIWVDYRSIEERELFKTLGDLDADLILGGTEEQYAKHQERFRPYQVEKIAAIADAYRNESMLWTPISIQTSVIVYNPRVIDRQRDVETWEDLLDASTEGQVAMALPRNVGIFDSGLVAILEAICSDGASLSDGASWSDGEDPHAVLDPLAKHLDESIFPSTTDVLESVANGIYAYGIALEGQAQVAKNKRMHLDYFYPEEGNVAMFECGAILKQARNVANAETFLDFLLSTESQELLRKTFFRRSVFKEILPPPGMETLSDLGIKILRADEWLAQGFDYDELMNWGECDEAANP